MDDVGNIFGKHHSSYVASVYGPNLELYRNAAESINPFLRGDVLDIGNGGIFTYDIRRARKIVAVDTCFKNIKGLKKISNVSYRYGDALSLQGIRPDSFDIVLAQFLLHHLAGKSFGETLKNASRALENAKRALRPGGTFMVVEPTVCPALALVERTLFGVIKIALLAFRIPMIHMFSSETVLKLMKETGFVNVKYHKIKHPQKIDLFTTALPNLIVMPGWFAFFRFHFFVGQVR
jgi:SAM-dependent methyltransferase